jgi:hypothetical protein
MRPVLVGLAVAVITLVGFLLHVAGGASTQEAVATTDTLADAIAAAEAEYNDLGTPEEKKFFRIYSDLWYGKDPRTADVSEGARQEMAATYLGRHKRAYAAVEHILALRTAFKASHPKWKASHPEFEKQEHAAELRNLQEQISDLKDAQPCELGGVPGLTCDLHRIGPRSHYLEP